MDQNPPDQSHVQWSYYNEKLVRGGENHGKVLQVLADPAYYSKNNSSFLYHNNSACYQGKEELVYTSKRVLPTEDVCNISAVKLPVLEG